MSLLGLNVALLLGQALFCWTSTKHVTGMVAEPNGTVWVSTWGGLLKREPDGDWQKLTVVDGLPGNELTGIALDKGQLQVSWPRGTFLWPGGQPCPRPESADVAPAIPSDYTGKPSEVTCSLPSLVGTMHDGLWEKAEGSWKKLTLNEPGGQDIQALAELDGTIYSASLSEPLDALTGVEWTTLSALPSPKSMIKHDTGLFLLQGDGTVDHLKGKTATRNLPLELPRKEARALASDGTSLFVAQWGGWSARQRRTSTHVLDLPELAGARTTCLLPLGDRLYVGTQGRGLAVVSLSNRSVTWIDERQGLTDDWITTLGSHDGKVYAGTFVGGLIEISETQARTVGGTDGENVTCLVEHKGRLWIGLRSGLGLLKDGRFVKSGVKSLAAAEVQALLSVQDTLWVGTRSGLFQWQTE